MRNGLLTVSIQGREALPVRAIPYVTGWQFSPDLVAQEFARTIGAPFAALQSVTTYHLQESTPVAVLPKEWDRVVATLAALEVRLRDLHPDDAVGYAEWLERSTDKLPAGAFVWLDEFKAEYSARRKRTLHIDQKREGDDNLTLSPMIEASTRQKIFEGFDESFIAANDSEDTEENIDFVGTFAEVVSNGRPINWRYWMSMKTLTAEQAARLMVGLDPDIFKRLDQNGPTRNETSSQRERARNIERLALNLGMTDATQSKWASWGKEQGFNIHTLFLLELQAKNTRPEALGRVNIAPEQPTSVCISNIAEFAQTKPVATGDQQFGANTTDEKASNFSPRIGWQIDLYEAWPAMRKLYGRNPTAAEAIRFLKTDGNSNYVLTKGGDRELWWKLSRGKPKEVQFKTVETLISSWRTRGVIPT